MKVRRKNKADTHDGTAAKGAAGKSGAETVARDKLPFLPPNLYGIIADQTIVVANLAVLGGASDYVRGMLTSAFEHPREMTGRFAALIFLVFILRLIGLYLKRLPLQARLKRAGEWDWLGRLTAGVMAFFVSFAPAILILVFASTPLMHENSSGAASASDANLFVFSVFGLTALDMTLFARAAYKPLTEREQARLKDGHWRFNRWTELAADFGLYLYMLAWQGFALSLLATIVPFTGALLYPVFPLTPMLFGMFYLAPRFLFAIEDFKYRATKLSLLAVYLSPALPALFKG